MVKEELNSEEKFFEKAVITEKFIKKYKKLMIASVVLIALIVGANMAYEANENSKIRAANTALSKLQKDPSDTTALNELKSLSPSLYDVWIYSQAIANKDMKSLKELVNSKTSIVGDLAKYETSKDIKSLDDYSSKQDAIFKDLALVESAVILMNENKVDEARNMLLKVSKESSLNKVVAALMHYGAK